MAAYVRYYPAGAWRDLPDTSTPARKEFYEGVEAQLANSVNKTPTADSDNTIIPVGSTIALAVGNRADTDPGPHTGTPPTNYFPIKFIHLMPAVAGVDIKGTTQGEVGWFTYPERTIDDSAEGSSRGVIVTSAYGGFALPQTKPVVGFEGIALAQGTVTVSQKLIGLVGTARVQDTAHVDSLIDIYASGATVAAGASVADIFGLYLESPTVSGTISGHKWSIHAPEDVRILKALVVGSSSATAAQVFVQNRVSSADPAVAIAAGTGQTGNTFEARNSTNTPLWAIDVAGIPQWVAAANQQTTVGAAGGGSALPATPVKYLKVKDSGGTSYVIPAYNP